MWSTAEYPRDRIVAHGSTVSRAGIRAVPDDYYTTIAALLMRGTSGNTSTACYRLRIVDPCTSLSDPFDPNRHRLGARAPGRR